MFTKDGQGIFWDYDGNKDVADVTPRNMHDISDADFLGYSYEPDEWDRKILTKALGNTCKLSKVFWHLEGGSAARLLRHEEFMSRNRKLGEDEDQASARNDILNYIEKCINDSKEKSIFIDAKSQEVDALETVVANECALLYKKNPVANSISTIANNTFWRRWGMTNDDPEALKGKCGGI